MNLHPAQGEIQISLQKVSVVFGTRQVFQSLFCDFPKGRISIILGGSGSGKSTILRLIGGLIHPREGRVVVDGEDVARLSGKRLRNLRRKLGMLFQGGALLDSYTRSEERRVGKECR